MKPFFDFISLLFLSIGLLYLLFQIYEMIKTYQGRKNSERFTLYLLVIVVIIDMISEKMNIFF